MDLRQRIPRRHSRSLRFLRLLPAGVARLPRITSPALATKRGVFLYRMFYNGTTDMKLIFLKHTSTDWDDSGRIKGQTDVGLNATGRDEARHLAERLRDFKIELIVSSDLSRARETAEIIRAALGVGAPVRLESNLHECSFGQLEGLTKEQALGKFGPELAGDWEDQHLAYNFRPFGGESRDEVLARHQAALQALAAESPDQPILIVGHGRGLTTLLATLGHSPTIKKNEFYLVEVK